MKRTRTSHTRMSPDEICELHVHVCQWRWCTKKSKIQSVKWLYFFYKKTFSYLNSRVRSLTSNTDYTPQRTNSAYNWWYLYNLYLVPNTSRLLWKLSSVRRRHASFYFSIRSKAWSKFDNQFAVAALNSSIHSYLKWHQQRNLRYYVKNEWP